jgi:hypothetical protein
MAQNVIKGITGSFQCSMGTATTTIGGRFYRWEANYHQDANDATGFGSAWRQREFGLQDIQGRAVGYLTDGTALDNPGITVQQAKAFIILTANSSCTLSGTAIISNIRLISDENSNDAISFDYASDGSWTTTWS